MITCLIIAAIVLYMLWRIAEMDYGKARDAERRIDMSNVRPTSKPLKPPK